MVPIIESLLFLLVLAIAFVTYRWLTRSVWLEKWLRDLQGKPDAETLISAKQQVNNEAKLLREDYKGQAQQLEKAQQRLNEFDK